MTDATSNNAATRAWGGWLAGLARSRAAMSCASSKFEDCARARDRATTSHVHGLPDRVPVSRATGLPAAVARTLVARLALSNGVRIAAVVIVVAAAALSSPDVARSSRVAAPEVSTSALASSAFLPTRVQPTLAPPTLAQTGLYADWATKTLASDVLPFAPQYPLWSDGAHKQRWISVPAAIDARDPDAWVFPVGTRIWKEFSFGARTETRFMHRADTGWTYATYVWSGDAAMLAPAGADVPIAGGVHQVPSETDCKSCHANGASPVLSFSALQLSLDRDPNAPHRDTHRDPLADVDLLSLVIAGFVVGLDDIAPRIPGPPTQRSALGYLHGNCGNCHRAEGPLAGLDLVLVQPVHGVSPALQTTANVPSRFGAPLSRIKPGDAEQSVLIARMRARHSAAQMPPIGTDVIDAEALRLVADWIDQLADNHTGE